jgi:hypothetical protein
MRLLNWVRGIIVRFMPTIVASAGGDNCWWPYTKCGDYCTFSYCWKCKNGTAYDCNVRIVEYSQDPTCPYYDMRSCWECSCYCSEAGPC